MVLLLVKGNVKKLNNFLPKVYVPDPRMSFKTYKNSSKKDTKILFHYENDIFPKAQVQIKRSLPTTIKINYFDASPIQYDTFHICTLFTYIIKEGTIERLQTTGHSAYNKTYFSLYGPEKKSPNKLHEHKQKNQINSLFFVFFLAKIALIDAENIFSDWLQFFENIFGVLLFHIFRIL